MILPKMAHACRARVHPFRRAVFPRVVLTRRHVIAHEVFVALTEELLHVVVIVRKEDGGQVVTHVVEVFFNHGLPLDLNRVRLVVCRQSVFGEVLIADLQVLGNGRRVFTPQGNHPLDGLRESSMLRRATHVPNVLLHQLERVIVSRRCERPSSRHVSSLVCTLMSFGRPQRPTTARNQHNSSLASQVLVKLLQQRSVGHQ